MDSEGEILNALPEIGEIDDPDLRKKVIEAWQMAIEEGNYDAIDEVPWWPPHEEVVGDQRQIDHLRDVISLSIAITDVLTAQRDFTVHRDLVIAGAVLHDISKLFEFSHGGDNELIEWLPHPLYSIYTLEKCGFSNHLKHIVMAHSHRSAVSPMTIEAKVVETADVLASNAIFVESTGELYDKAN